MRIYKAPPTAQGQWEELKTERILFMKYVVKEILEPDYGCEERPVGYKKMDRVLLCDENGGEKVVEVLDDELYAKDIDEGDLVCFDDDGSICK